MKNENNLLPNLLTKLAMKRILLWMVFAISTLFTVNMQGQTCTGSLTVTIGGSGTGSPLGTSFTKTDVLCFGSSTGAIDLTVTGGTLTGGTVTATDGYQYDWGGGVTTEDRIALAAGTYTVTVTDDNGCTKTTSVVITENALVVASGTQVNVLCNGGTTGSIDLMVTGGSGSYTYLWSNSATTQDISGLSAGTYTAVITESNSCTITGTTSFTITQNALVVASGTQVNVLCNGGTTGSIDLTVSGGSGSYAYLWSNSATTQDISGLSAGTYTAVITESNSCTVTGTTSFTITQAPAIVAGTCDITNDACQVNAGEIKVAASGGTGTLNVTWGAYPQAPFAGPATGTPAGTAQAIPMSGFIIYSGLSGNTQYKFKVTDANGCFVGEN